MRMYAHAGPGLRPMPHKGHGLATRLKIRTHANQRRDTHLTRALLDIGIGHRQWVIRIVNVAVRIYKFHKFILADCRLA